LLLIVLAGGVLISTLLFADIFRLEQRGQNQGATPGMHINHRTSWVTLVLGLALTATTAAYLITEKRRSGEVRILIDRLCREVCERRESETRHRLLIENAPDAILTMDPQGVVSWANPAAEAALGRSRQDLVTRFMDDLVHQEDRPKLRKLMEDALHGRTPSHAELRLSKISGQPVIMEFALTPEFEANRVSGLFAIGRDVSARRKAEAAAAALELQLHRAQKMEALGRLAGGIAHDFNNFLTTIMANCQMARMDLVSCHPAVVSLDQINEASGRAADLVRQILAYTRNQSPGRHVLNLEPIVRDAVKLLRSIVPAAISIEARLDPNCLPVQANVEQIHQVLLNLGTNAAHAMQDMGGALEIALEPVNVDEALAARHPGLRVGAYVRLKMRDHGCGMDAETLHRIFDPFFTTKSAGEGTGLGLSVVDSIVKSHDAIITVQSEIKKGTFFHLYFPVVPGGAARAEADLSVLPHGNGQQVLLVDGDPALTESAKRLCEKLGYQASVCASAVEALSWFRAAPAKFDCVISDLAMPDLNGLELAAECGQCRPGIPFILMSSTPSVLSADSLKALGVGDFILKPFAVRALAEALHRAMPVSEI
jgi:PAS domain S-box-containing protein